MIQRSQERQATQIRTNIKAAVAQLDSWILTISVGNELKPSRQVEVINSVDCKLGASPSHPKVLNLLRIRLAISVALPTT
jgi:hypothetical protein